VRLVRAWHRGDDEPGLAAAVDRAASQHPRALARTLWIIGVVVATPLAVLALALPSHHTSPVDLAELAVGFQSELALVVMSAFVLLEQVWRPTRAGLDGALRAPRATRRLASRLMLPLLSLTFTSCVFVGALFASRDKNGAGELFVIIGVGLGVTLLW